MPNGEFDILCPHGRESLIPPDVANVSTKTETIDFTSIQERKEFLNHAREECGRRHAEGVSGIEICHWFSDQLDFLLGGMMRVHLSAGGIAEDDQYSVICVGGNGRRRPAPFSDVDLLLVAETAAASRLEPAMSAFVRDCWDTGFQLGHSIRTPDDVVRFANEDIQFATSLVDMRHLLGNQEIFDALQELVDRRVFKNVDRFVTECVASRRDEWMARGDSVNQLEPDVKRSPGGLRDLHLIAWVTNAQYHDSSPVSLLEQDSIRTGELIVINQVDEFLTSLRLDLHLRAGLKQDVLTRDLQVEIVRSRGAEGEMPRAEVEAFMQEYFRQTSELAEIARRVTETVSRPGLFQRLKRAVVGTGLPTGYLIEDGILTITEDALMDIRQGDPEKVMDVFQLAAERQVMLAPDLRHRIGRLAESLPPEPSQAACKSFRAILRSEDGLPLTLRALFETRVLDWLIPQMAEIRCLMQFNQYHSYTVDEHTLKTIDEVVSFADDNTPVGTAYNSVRHKATLHISLILHDIGKGRDGDHSIVGEGIAEEVAVRLQTPENKKRMMMFLVRQHLIMPDLAFRRDITDQALLVDFARLVGAPELLRMLYVLCVADIKAVGSDVWTDWKGDLLADLYNRTMLILSGRPINHLEQERLSLVREHVRGAIAPMAPTPIVESAPDSDGDDQQSVFPEWIDRQLDGLPPFYLMMESPDRIARDLDVIQQLRDEEVKIEGSYDPETDTVTYRIFAGSDHESGSFHKVAGVLSGMRMDIHTAQTCTTVDSTLIGSFLVSDNDFIGTVAEHRINEVCQALVDVLTGKKTVDHIFRRSGLFRFRKPEPVLDPKPPQVTIDNDCSETATVIDVFAMDNPGLLYTLGLTLFNLDLVVKLTRIATNVDQVVDVFYVVEQDGQKVRSDEKLHHMYVELMREVTELEQQLRGS